MAGGVTMDIPDIGEIPEGLEVLSPDREFNEEDYR